MNNTNAFEIIESFESSFADRQVLPYELELVWLKKAIGRYCMELEPLHFDEEILEFDTKLDRYIIDTLAAFMKQYYQERQVSLVNKRISIVSKDISIDGSNGTKISENVHLDYAKAQASEMVKTKKGAALA